MLCGDKWQWHSQIPINVPQMHMSSNICMYMCGDCARNLPVVCHYIMLTLFSSIGQSHSVGRLFYIVSIKKSGHINFIDFSEGKYMHTCVVCVPHL